MEGKHRRLSTLHALDNPPDIGTKNLEPSGSLPATDPRGVSLVVADTRGRRPQTLVKPAARKDSSARAKVSRAERYSRPSSRVAREPS